ncbi:MAG: nondiscriminating glutamyl-tRNA synthetase [Thermotogaceae bacterium]|nr:nondiscriminating glutamyl-tRNA synthetase [Thermotogaceae bacterium]MDN5337269.1 nondiscriminating glutamyl-tRNA synthetase [Thermotogaceae bacterium]
MEVRVRFAPSPTGYLHVGGARTALFNFLFARNQGGKFILRIEDTDLERSTKESELKLMESLKWLGLKWDEGPDIGGNYGPYRQSERLNFYRDVVKELMEKGKAYEVYARPEELEELREKLLSKGELPHYNREMLEQFNTKRRIEEFKNNGEKPVVFFVFEDKEYELDDLIKGKVIFRKGAIGDFVLLRSNGIPTYNFACVVDDHFMNITHVIRGDDHLSNTLRQMAMYESLNWEVPHFAHVSMILGPDGKKLSKRHGVSSVEGYRDRGYLPEAMVNYLALLGWSHPDGKELLTLEELIDNFSLERVSSNPAIYDENKLRWMNGYYIRNYDIEDLTKIAKKFIVDSQLCDEEEFENNFEWFKEAVASVRNGVEELIELPEKLKIYFEKPSLNPDDLKLNQELIEAYLKLSENIKKIDDWSKNEILRIFRETLKENRKLNKKDFYMNLRIILTGKTEGPELLDIVYLFGKDKVLKRLLTVESFKK